MTLVVEDGTGLYNANGYVNTAFVRDYLTQRNDATAWSAASLVVRKAAIIAATDYAERRNNGRFKGSKAFVSVDIPASIFISVEAIPVEDETLTIGSQVYTFKDAPATAYDIDIGADKATTASNIVAAINAGSGSGTAYGTGTVANTQVTAEVLSSTEDVRLTAITAGEDGNEIAISSTAADIVPATSTLTSGTLEGEQALSFPRVNAYSRDGVPILGIPTALKEAIAEYANRAIAAALLPDPSIDSTGKVVTRKKEKLGPLEEETVYADGALLGQLIKPYPMADRLMSDLITGGGNGGVYR